MVPLYDGVTQSQTQVSFALSRIPNFQPCIGSATYCLHAFLDYLRRSARHFPSSQPQDGTQIGGERRQRLLQKVAQAERVTVSHQQTALELQQFATQLS